VVGTEFGFHNRIRQLEVGLALLVSLQVVHTAAQVVINRSGIHSIAAETLLSNLTCFQIATESPRRLIDVVEHRTETTVGKGFIGMVTGKLNVEGTHVA
jgi:hypothetical protein